MDRLQSNTSGTTGSNALNRVFHREDISFIIDVNALLSFSQDINGTLHRHSLDKWTQYVGTEVPIPRQENAVQYNIVVIVASDVLQIYVQM